VGLVCMVEIGTVKLFRPGAGSLVLVVIVSQLELWSCDHS